jgi:hypothetical protein
MATYAQHKGLKRKAMRTSEEVLQDHLDLAKNGSLAEDLTRNYAENVVLLTTHGIFKGLKGVEELAAILRREMPNATFEYHKILVEGEIGFLEWSASSKDAKVKDGADSYVIRNGVIIAQTIYYTVMPADQSDG